MITFDNHVPPYIIRWNLLWRKLCSKKKSIRMEEILCTRNKEALIMSKLKIETQRELAGLWDTWESIYICAIHIIISFFLEGGRRERWFAFFIEMFSTAIVCAYQDSFLKPYHSFLFLSDVKCEHVEKEKVGMDAYNFFWCVHHSLSKKGGNLMLTTGNICMKMNRQEMYQQLKPGNGNFRVHSFPFSLLLPGIARTLEIMSFFYLHNAPHKARLCTYCGSQGWDTSLLQNLVVCASFYFVGRCVYPF